LANQIAAVQPELQQQAEEKALLEKEMAVRQELQQ
jgi:hypothetical protein